MKVTPLALHEAAHGVAAVVLGAELRRVTIVRERDFDGRAVLVPPRCREHLIVVFAGPVAELLAGGEPSARLFSAWRRDAESVRRLVKVEHGRSASRRWWTRAVVHEAIHAAAALVRVHWTAIIEVAGLLEIEKELSGAAVRHVLDNLTNPIRRKEFVSWQLAS